MRHKRANSVAAMLLLAIGIGLSTGGCGGGGRAAMATTAHPTPSPTPAATPVPNASPTATALSPNLLTAHGPDFTLTVEGANFVASSVVNWNGSKVAVTSLRELNRHHAPNVNFASNSWVINADGSNPMPLTKFTAGGVRIFSPAWTPDCSKIAFVSTANVDGGDSVNPSNTQNI